MKINWVQKLTSRKFWAAIVAVITSVCVIFGVKDITMEQVTALIMAVGALIAYILGEGFVMQPTLNLKRSKKMLIFEGRNRVTSGFRLSDRPDHDGLDIVGDDSGIFYARLPYRNRIHHYHKQIRFHMEWGNYVCVKDTSGKKLYFCHMDSRAVTVGQSVKPGDKLGVMGNTGYSFGAHTHFEVRTGDNAEKLDPAAYLGIPNTKGTYTTGKTGWVQASNAWYYYEDGAPVKSAWRLLDGWWYYLGADGKMYTGLHAVGTETFYFCEASASAGGLYIPQGACIITDKRGNILGV